MSEDQFSVDSKAIFTPFWRRFPHFFLYPLQTGSIMRIAGYSLLVPIAMLFPFNLDLILHFLYMAFFLKFALMSLSRTARGYFDEPDGIDDKDAGDWSQIARLYFYLGVLFLLNTLLAYRYGESGDQLGILLFNLLMPAGIVIITMSRSFFQALNPLQYKHYIGAIGTPYLSLCFILFSMSELANWWHYFLIKHFHSWLSYPLSNFIEFYFILMACHMVGYVIYQYHDVLELGAAISFDNAEARLEPQKAINPILRELNTLVAEGHFDRAIELLEIELRKDWNNNDTHERYQKVLFSAGKHTRAMDHARDFISKLINEKRFFMAIDLCEKWLRIDPTFKLNDSYQVYELASAARMAKLDRFALELMQDFDKNYIDHPHIPQIYLLTAQILSGVFQKNREAMQILKTLLAAYPEHNLAPEARQFLIALGKLPSIS